MKRLRITHMALIVALFMEAGCAPDNEKATSNMNQTVGKWQIFVPPESEEGVCRISEARIRTPSGSPAIELHSEELARFGIRPLAGGIPVQAGQRYRLSAWVKPGKDLVLLEHSPTVLLRGTLFDKEGLNHEKGHYYVGKKGTALGASEILGDQSFDSEWTKLEGVIVIPPGAAQLKLFVFCWWTKGSILVDDPRVELVSGDVKLSKLL